MNPWVFVFGSKEKSSPSLPQKGGDNLLTSGSPAQCSYWALWQIEKNASLCSHLKLVTSKNYENYLDYLDFKFHVNTFGIYSFICRLFTIGAAIMILFNFYG
jgi:hypothetical protein